MDRRQFIVEEILWTYSKKEDGRHPIKIRVTYNRRSKFYPLLIDGKRQYATADHWKSILDKSNRRDNRKTQVAIEEIKTRAYDAYKVAISGKGNFTFERFEREFLEKTSNRGFFSFFEEYLDNLKKEERIGTYESYNGIFKAFKKFRKGKDIDPIDLTTEVLKSYEAYLQTPKPRPSKKEEKTFAFANKTTIGMHMRTIRAVYNFMLGSFPFLQEHYPFSTKGSKKDKYKIRTGSGKQGDALELEDLKKFFNTTPIESSIEWKAKLYWLFSFYCNGMNVTDIAYLKYSNIEKDHIRYVRRKTRNTEQNEECIEIPLNKSIQEILDQLSTNRKLKNDYVFDILIGMEDIMQERKLIKQKTKMINKGLKKLCESHGIPKITTYWARHTYASMLKEAGEPYELIQEMLGHADIKTTKHYLKRFDLDKKRKANHLIINQLK